MTEPEQPTGDDSKCEVEHAVTHTVELPRAWIRRRSHNAPPPPHHERIFISGGRRRPFRKERLSAQRDGPLVASAELRPTKSVVKTTPVIALRMAIAVTSGETIPLRPPCIREFAAVCVERGRNEGRRQRRRQQSECTRIS